MTRKTSLMGVGMSGTAANFMVGDVASALTATGSSVSDALQLTGDVNEVTTTASGTGVKLPPMSPGDSCFIYNIGAQTLSVYPPTGESINALSANAVYSVATAKTVLVVKVSATRYATLLTA